MCTPDLDRDSTSLDVAQEDFSAALGHSLQGLRVGVPAEFFGDGLAADVRRATEAALKQLQALGATLVPIGLPRTELSIPVYYIIAPAEASSNLSRFDGVKFGHRAAEFADLTDMYKKTRAEGFGQEVKRRIILGTYALSSGYYDAYYGSAQKVRTLIQDRQMNDADASIYLEGIQVIVDGSFDGLSFEELQHLLPNSYLNGMLCEFSPKLTVACND
jgi:aspartyl-tRNA(Asn)/glutamyl-tRNA(Gln) amidotransferase subunit A